MTKITPEIKTFAADVAVHGAFFMEGLIEHVGILKCSEALIDEGGCIELVVGITAHATFLQEMLLAANEHNQNITYPGVLDYEVSSYFGKWYGEQVVTNHDFPSNKAAEEWLIDEVGKFFSQAMSKDESTELEAFLNSWCVSRHSGELS